jgi:type IV pilus assembly protein PilE
MRRSKGFTLIELMVVLAIVAILAAIAVPSYLGQVRKSRRADAIRTLSDLELRQERWRASHTAYTNTLTDLNSSSTLASDYYNLVASTPSTAGTCTCTNANCYAFTATAKNDQISDSACATLVLANRCGTISKTSTPAGNKCW